MAMALWKQPREQPFTTYRDPKTGRWMTVKPAQLDRDTIVEAPLYREPSIGQWITIKPSVPSPIKPATVTEGSTGEER